MEMIQRDIEHDNLEEARNNLNDFTGKIKRRYEREIHMDNDRLIDEWQLGFINENPDLSFDEILLVKRVFDYRRD